MKDNERTEATMNAILIMSHFWTK